MQCPVIGMLCYAVSYHATLRCVMLCYVVLCYAVLCHDVLFYAMFCYAMLSYVMHCSKTRQEVCFQNIAVAADGFLSGQKMSW